MNTSILAFQLLQATSSVNFLQAYLQYVTGKATLMGGKFLTLAGAEGAVPTSNANVTRSLRSGIANPPLM